MLCKVGRGGEGTDGVGLEELGEEVCVGGGGCADDQVGGGAGRGRGLGEGDEGLGMSDSTCEALMMDDFEETYLEGIEGLGLLHDVEDSPDVLSSHSLGPPPAGCSL